MEEQKLEQSILDTLEGLKTEDPEEYAFAVALIQSAGEATARANKLAKESGIPLIELQGDTLYHIYPGGRKEVYQHLKRRKTTLPKEFRLP